ncbi:MAG: ABC transporter ATP-binding protein [Anaerolineae bacterium]|jgi:ABC-2 type transport system ATP-binding protein|nr:ABC transporter ATP-binding protein [Anaerolineae bacterium]MDH7472410.1 ABC transporter ATP-binding protein [Anaerolineae bacterium]
MIKTRGLTKRFGDVFAVDNLSLDVAEGEVFGLLGPNGAGKTTTVRLLTCLIAPTAGEAWVNGHRVGEEDMAIRQCVGILTEAPGLYERLNAEQNLTLYAKLYGVNDVGGQVQKYLDMLGLWERRTEPVGSFSKGMKQKLAIARALIHEPRVLFLDEPTSALDPEAAKLVRDFILEVKGEGRTIFLCTHNLDEADRLCDRIAVMRQHLIQVDTPAGLRQSLYGRKVVLQLQEISQAVLSTVRALPFVHQAQEEDRKLIVSLDDPEAQNPILVRHVVEAGGAVQFLTEQRHSLEEVYFTLMREEGETLSAGQEAPR